MKGEGRPDISGLGQAQAADCFQHGKNLHLPKMRGKPTS